MGSDGAVNETPRNSNLEVRVQAFRRFILRQETFLRSVSLHPGV